MPTDGEPVIENAGCRDGQFCCAHNGGAPGVPAAEWRVL